MKILDYKISKASRAILKRKPKQYYQDRKLTEELNKRVIKIMDKMFYVMLTESKKVNQTARHIRLCRQYNKLAHINDLCMYRLGRYIRVTTADWKGIVDEQCQAERQRAERTRQREACQMKWLLAYSTF